jgi:hypothetical protein
MENNGLQDILTRNVLFEKYNKKVAFRNYLITTLDSSDIQIPGVEWQKGHIVFYINEDNTYFMYNSSDKHLYIDINIFELYILNNTDTKLKKWLNEHIMVKLGFKPNSVIDKHSFPYTTKEIKRLYELE